MIGEIEFAFVKTNSRSLIDDCGMTRMDEAAVEACQPVEPLTGAPPGKL